MSKFLLFVIIILNTSIAKGESRGYISAALDVYMFDVNSKKVTMNDSTDDFIDCSADGVNKCIKLDGTIIAIPDNIISENVELELKVYSLNEKEKIYAYPILRKINLLSIEHEGYVIHLENSNTHAEEIIFFSKTQGVLMFSNSGNTFISQFRCGLFAPKACEG